MCPSSWTLYADDFPFSFYCFLSSSSKTRARAVWSLGDKRAALSSVLVTERRETRTTWGRKWDIRKLKPIWCHSVAKPFPSGHKAGAKMTWICHWTVAKLSSATTSTTFELASSLPQDHIIRVLTTELDQTMQWPAMIGLGSDEDPYYGGILWHFMIKLPFPSLLVATLWVPFLLI